MDIQAGDIARDFLSILLEGIPFIFLGTLVSGIIDSFLPSGVFTKLLPRRASAAVLISGLLGAVFPMCECGIVPVIRRLIQKGLPVSCAITYMLSAPIINPVVAFSTWSAFKGDRPWFMMSSRLIMAYMIAVAAGMIISKIPIEKILNNRVLRGAVRAAKEKEADGAHGHAHAAPDSLPGKLKAAMRTAMRDFLDVALYFVIGIAITAILKQQAGRELILPLAKGSEAVAVGSMMGFAFILSLCSTSDAFIASTLNMFSKASRLAFLVFGPMVDVKLIFMYSSVFRSRFVVWLVAGLFVLVGLLSLTWGLN